MSTYVVCYHQETTTHLIYNIWPQSNCHQTIVIILRVELQQQCNSELNIIRSSNIRSLIRNSCFIAFMCVLFFSTALMFLIMINSLTRYFDSSNVKIIIEIENNNMAITFYVKHSEFTLRWQSVINVLFNFWWWPLSTRCNQ